MIIQKSIYIRIIAGGLVSKISDLLVLKKIRKESNSNFFVLKFRFSNSQINGLIYRRKGKLFGQK